jgi:tetratricopeptide (TPR) repeat protein
MGRRDLALEDFNRAIALDGRHANSYTNRAMIYADTGRTDLAIGDYSRAIALRPEKSANHLNLAELYLVSERYQELLACLQRADPLLREEDDRLVLCYLRSIAQRMLKLDFRESDLCFERILARVAYVGWSFDAIEGWLGKAYIEEEPRRDIVRLTQQLKAKTKI